MRAKSDRRLQTEAMRREQGLSYKEIEALTGVNRSTLSGWLKDIRLAPEQEARLQERLRANRSAFAARALPINRERHERVRKEAYASGAQVALDLDTERAVDELALAMLYAGEGAKRSGVVQIANMNPDVLRYFLWALRFLYNIDEHRLSFRLNIVAAARPNESAHKLWWCEQLGCQPDQFSKSQFDSRSPPAVITDDYHGVCTVTHSSTRLQQRILGLAWTYMRGHSAQ
jgi:transcriptional regulator with XRE-family HTH domain